jgi:putative transposase
MPRTPRHCPAGEIFHVLNRAVARMQIFEKPEDYDAFIRVVEETVEIVPLPICSMIAMPNHWHFVVQPTDDKQVSEFFRRLTVTHTMRWHAHYKTSGSGHLYQGRFKSFPIQDDEHFLWVMRYVERNALRANLVEDAEEWTWGSAYLRRLPKSKRPSWLKLPKEVTLPRNWRSLVNQPLTDKEAKAIQRCIKRGSPFGESKWATQSAARLGLESTLRARGRPKKET